MGIGEMWRHIFSKYVIKVTGSEATHTCRDDHICPGFKAGIDRELHRVQYIWESNLTEEKWIFLLVDAKNKFNEINRIEMLWTVRHLWPSEARFLKLISSPLLFRPKKRERDG